MLDDTSIMKTYLAPAKWELVKRIINTARDNGHRIEILVATADGGEVSGIPARVVQGQMTMINISQGACRFVNLSDDSFSVDTEVRFSGVSTLLSMHVGTIAGFIVDNTEIPLQLPCWPVECVLGRYAVVDDGNSQNEQPGDNVIPLFSSKLKH